VAEGDLEAGQVANLAQADREIVEFKINKAQFDVRAVREPPLPKPYIHKPP
jgi:hypothetical protein